MDEFPFPTLGDVPDGWEQLETFWVDHTGCGKASEPALTIDQFRTLLYDHVADNPDDSYAITCVGQFQLTLRRVRSEVADTLSERTDQSND